MLDENAIRNLIQEEVKREIEKILGVKENLIRTFFAKNENGDKIEINQYQSLNDRTTYADNATCYTTGIYRYQESNGLHLNFIQDKNAFCYPNNESVLYKETQ